MLTPWLVLEKNIMPDSLELGTKSSHFSFNRKSDTYPQVGIDGAEKFKLNMKDANCQALDCTITLDLMNPNV